VWGTYSTVIYQSAELLKTQATSFAVFAPVLASEVTAVGCTLNKYAMPPMITLLKIKARARAVSLVEIEVFMIVSYQVFPVFSPSSKVFR
jgi:hypothetical protein